MPCRLGPKTRYLSAVRILAAARPQILAGLLVHLAHGQRYLGANDGEDLDANRLALFDCVLDLHHLRRAQLRKCMSKRIIRCTRVNTGFELL